MPSYCRGPQVRMDRRHCAAGPFNDTIHSEKWVAMLTKASGHDENQQQNCEECQSQFLVHRLTFRNLNKSSQLPDTCTYLSTNTCKISVGASSQEMRQDFRLYVFDDPNLQNLPRIKLCPTQLQTRTFGRTPIHC